MLEVSKITFSTLQVFCFWLIPPKIRLDSPITFFVAFTIFSDMILLV